jgi:hypothetical protein
MLAFNEFVRNPKAPKLLVNDVGDIHRLEGGIIQVSFLKVFDRSTSSLNPTEQVTLLWPEHRWVHYVELMAWALKAMQDGYLTRIDPSGRHPGIQ